MPIIGVTGGVATGKSTFVDRFLCCYTAKRFSADEFAKELVDTDAAVRSSLVEEFGEKIFFSNGNLDRKALRDLTFSLDEKRRALEQILHPRIRKRWKTLANECRASGGHLVAEIPLLFETGTEAEFDIVIVVAASQIQQMKRLSQNRQLTNKTAEQILAAQMDLNQKIQKADHVIWNESSLQWLDKQASLVALHLSAFS